jgi:hypothetical protein
VEEIAGLRSKPVMPARPLDGPRRASAGHGGPIPAHVARGPQRPYEGAAEGGSTGRPMTMNTLGKGRAYGGAIHLQGVSPNPRQRMNWVGERAPTSASESAVH